MFLIVPAPSEAGVLVGQLGQAPGAVVLRLPPFPVVGDSGCSPPRLRCLRRPQLRGERRRQPRTDAVPRASTVLMKANVRENLGLVDSGETAIDAARHAATVVF